MRAIFARVSCVLAVCVVFWLCVLCFGCVCCVLAVCVVFWLCVLCFGCVCCVLAVCVVFWLCVLCFGCVCCVLAVCVVFWLCVLCFVLVGHRTLFAALKMLRDENFCILFDMLFAFDLYLLHISLMIIES